MEDKLRHIVPPQIRVFADELKQQISDILNEHYEMESKVESEQR